MLRSRENNNNIVFNHRFKTTHCGHLGGSGPRQVLAYNQFSKYELLIYFLEKVYFFFQRGFTVNFIDRIITKEVHLIWTFLSAEHCICLVRPDRE